VAGGILPDKEEVCEGVFKGKHKDSKYVKTVTWQMAADWQRHARPTWLYKDKQGDCEKHRTTQNIQLNALLQSANHKTLKTPTKRPLDRNLTSMPGHDPQEVYSSRRKVST
jgi:hypothetical protein